MVNIISNHYRVLALVAIQKKKRWDNLTNDQKAICKLLEKWPDARRIQRADRCHCKHGQQWSFVLHGDKLGDVREQCGYYCPACNFSNAGSRPVWKRK
jgi:hypothetical protein